MLINKNTQKKKESGGQFAKKAEPLPTAFPGSPKIVSDSIDCDK